MRDFRSHLSAQVGNNDELLQDIFRQNVRVARFLDVVGRHVDVIGSQVQVGGRDGSHAPLGFRRERGRFVVAGGGRDDLVAVFVDGSRGGSRQLRLFLGLLLDLSDLLTLRGRRRDFHAQNNVADLGLGQ